jgi:stress response protein YsnF
MELPNTRTDNNDNVFLLEKNKNKENFKENKNPLIVAPLQSEKVTIIVKSPTLKDKESLRSEVGEVLESVKENASNVVDKVIRVEEQDINSFKRDTESISQSQQQQQSIEEFVIPVVAENYSFSKMILSEDISIEKRWIEKDEIKIPVRYEKLFVNNKEIDVYSKQGIISQIKEKISDLVQSDDDDDNGNVNKMKENEDDDNKNQKHKKDIENQKREEPQLKGESVPLFDNQQTENSNEQLYQDNNNNKELINNNKYQTLIPLYAEEITVSKKMVKVGEIALSKRRIVETENVDVDTIKERINVEHADGRKEKIN